MDPELLRSLFPGVRITSGARDPKSRLGRANPRSYHNIGRAYDVAPIPGMKFDDFIGRIKGAGVNVVEARDEVTNPSRHATGPHWHFAYGDKPAMRRPDPITQRLMPNYLQMSQPQNGVDPLAPMQPPQQPMMTLGGQSIDPQIAMQQQPNFAAMSQPGYGIDPLAPTKGPSKGMKILGTIAGSIGDALMAYGGQRGVFAPFMQSQMEQEGDERRFREKLAAEHQFRMEAARAKAMEPELITNSAGDKVRIYGDGRQEVLYFDPYGKPRTESRVNPATGALEVFNTGSTPRPEADDIADLRRDPSLARDFDAEFGPGAAQYFLRNGGL